MNIFQSFPVRKPKGNIFNLSHEKKMSFNMGELIPCYVQDVVPGDRFRVSSEVFMRFAPLLAPVMHRINVFVHYFFVPNRISWPEASSDGWEYFITGGPDGTGSPTFPTLTVNDTTKGGAVAGSLGDYLGLPPTDGLTVTQDLIVSALPFRAYQHIYNEYYRDPNLTSEVSTTSTSFGTMSAIRKRCWEKDYFTSCLPWSQRGGDVNLPVEGIISYVPDYTDVSTAKLSGGGVPATGDVEIEAVTGIIEDISTANIRIENLEALTEYDLEDVTITINDLRQSVRLQQWLERNARGGGRYIEQVLSHFGVRSSDARLQRPEYLGGGKSPVVISEVLSTADSGSSDVSDMFGHGISVGRTNTFNKFFEEHGYVIGIISVLPRTAYQNGCPRHFLKTDKFDYYFPEFANLGEQEVFNQEIFHDYEGTDDATDTFGYQSRYAEYKYMPSSVHGDFKDELTYWHLGRILTSTPSLNTSFVELDHTTAGVHRIHVVTSSSYDKLYAQIYNNVKAWRPMPKYGIPIL